MTFYIEDATIHTATEAMTVYKVVYALGNGTYESEFPPDNRVVVARSASIGLLPWEKTSYHKGHDVGTMRHYKLGHTYQSSLNRTPGLMSWAQYHMATYHGSIGCAIIECRIPKGTRYMVNGWRKPGGNPANASIVSAEKLCFVKLKSPRIS